jgi:hypothetical protein
MSVFTPGFVPVSVQPFLRKFRLRCEELELRDVPAAFTLVALPDTQVYAESHPATFHAQTQWIVDNQARQNIVFVTHEGDIVQNAEYGSNRNATEWARADAAMDRLDGEVPYSVTLGNHDYARISVPESGSQRYLQYFGPERYRGRDWYGGSSENGANHFQYFEGDGRKFLHITLQYEPTDTDIAWAQSVIDANKGMPTVYTTHSYLNDAVRGRQTALQGGSNSGEQVWQKLIKKNPQIFMVLNGHFSGEYQQTSLNDAGLPVFEMVADYQSRADGGQGFLRLIQFDPDRNKIHVKTYSPTLNRYETDSNSQFSYTVDFNARFGPVTPPPPAGTIKVSTFRDGENGYTGTVDTQLKKGSPNTAYGNRTDDLVSDFTSTTSGETSQVLIRFDGMFGNAARQIPAGAVILSAELVVDTNNPGDGGTFHRMASDWSNGSTWNSLTGGVSTNNIEARSAYTSAAGSPSRDPNLAEGKIRINVTQDVQAWADGEKNRGWLIKPWANGTDGWGFSPSEVSKITNRPQLRIEWVPGNSALASFQQGVDNYGGTVDTTLALNAPASRQDGKELIVTDGPKDDGTRYGLLRFDNLFGAAAGQVPAGATVEWARLYLTTPYSNSNAPGGGAELHRMLQAWNAGATWNASFGGNGLQADGIEAVAATDRDTGTLTFGTKGFDVTAGVTAWANGQANRGWGLFYNTNDASMFASAERFLIGERPRLVVAYRLAAPAAAARNQPAMAMFTAPASVPGLTLPPPTGGISLLAQSMAPPTPGQR